MAEHMLFSPEKFLAFMVLGFGTGLYGTLIGAGGGFVLMPVLLLLYPTQSPEQLTSISLAVVFFNALGGSEAYALMRRIDYRSGLIFAAATIPGAIFGALHTAYVPRHIFNAIFGVLLLVGGSFILLRANIAAEVKKAHHWRYEWSRHIMESSGTVYDYSFNPLIGVGLSFFVGYVSSFLGIGGGIIHVPALTNFLGFPVHIATATSHFVLAIMAFTGTVTHIMTGTLSHGVDMTLSLAIGALLGAPLGAHLSNLIQANWIIRGLALALVLVGLRILVPIL